MRGRTTAGVPCTSLAPPVSPLDDLTPDQRAVLQLLLKQGKRYDELAALLRIDAAAVRQRAIAAVSALGPEVDDADRGALADWLLGQLDDEGRAASLDLLTASPAALQWAVAVGDRLRAAGLEPRGELPASAADVAPAETEPAEPADPGPGPGPDREAAPEHDAAPDAPPGPLPGFSASPSDDARPSRLGGMLLIGGLLVVIVVVAVLLLGGDDDPATSTTAGTATAAQTAEATTPTTGEITVEAQVNLRAPGGGDALGVAQIITDGTTRGVSVTAEGLEPNGERDRYALWLTGGAGGTAYLLGFSTTPVGDNGRFGGSAELPEDADAYRRIVLSLETRSEPTEPSDVVLRGAFK